MLFALLTLLACGPSPIEVPKQELTVACGMCIFEIEGRQGCYWAAELDGEYYPVTGRVPEGHNSHAPDGMCNMERRAVVEGEIRGKLLVAHAFELKPVKKEAVPANPKFTPADTEGH